MNLLNKAIDQLRPSKAVFSITQENSWNNDTHRARLSKISEPSKCEGDTPIERLVNNCFSESFNSSTNKYQIDEAAIVTSCQQRIKEDIVKFLERHMTQKYPMETKMGLFYRDYAFTKDVPAFNNALISTYNFYREKEDVHNTMKLLEFLFIKHRNDFPEEPKRKKRRRRR